MTYMVTICITGVKRNPDKLTLRQKFDLEDTIIHYLNDDNDDGPEFDYDWEEEE